MMKYIQLLAAFAVLGTGTAAADVSLSLGFELEQSDSVTSLSYDCGDDEAFDVSYVNASANALAVMEIDDEDRIFVSVVSGSGARYVSGSYVWSSKGDTATLENTLAADSDSQCVVRN